MELSKGRDLRKRGWFWLDDEYLNGYARHLGTTATCVYLCLCRHVDKEQTCFPKMETIAKEIGTVKNTVITAIHKLEEWGIIEVKREYDTEKKKQKVNIYLLTDKTYWKHKPEQSAINEPSIPGCNKSEKQGANKDESRVQPLSHKVTHINNTHIKDINETSSLEISELIKSFEIINPASKKFYGNPTQRGACDELLKLYGFEKVRSVIERTLPKTNMMPYFPNINSPLKLYEKWSTLESAITQWKIKSNKTKVAILSDKVKF